MLEDQPSMDVFYQLGMEDGHKPEGASFLWRCLSNSLPVAGNMLKRHMAKEASCLRFAQRKRK